MELLKVLHFEDNETDAELVEYHLKQYFKDCEISWINSAEGLEKELNSGTIDIVLSDYDLPGVKDELALNMIQELNLKIPVIYVSGTLGERAAVDLIKKGATDFVLKNYLDKLPNVVERALKEVELQIKKREATEKLIESEKKYKKVFNALNNVYVELDSNFKITLISPLVTDYFNKTPDQLEGKSFQLLFKREENFNEFCTLAKTSGDIDEFELVSRLSDKITKYFTVKATIQYDSTGNFGGLCGTINDITNRKRSEKQLKRVKGNLSRAEQLAKLGSYRYNVSKRQVEYFSDDLQNLFHLITNKKRPTEEEFIQQLVNKNERISIMSIIEEDRKHSPFEQVFKVRAKSGDEFYLKEVIEPVYDSNGRLKDIFGAIQDITELQSSKNQLEQAFKELKVEHLKALKYQKQFLNTQMNPHFIFNALNSIQYYILDTSQELALEFLSKFSNLMRQVLNNSERDYISISDETAFLRNYLNLEKERFKGKFDYEMKVSEDIDEEHTLISPMFLQPFVENAVIHGMSHLTTNGMIQITFSHSEDSNKLLCIVKDNGVGRKKVQEIKLKRGSKKHKSKAMNISSDRLEILKKIEGEVFEVKINDLINSKNEATGTEVVIEMPLIEDV